MYFSYLKVQTDSDWYKDEYLHVGLTCWKVVLMDCVHWPPGPNHTELESKHSPQETR